MSHQPSKEGSDSQQPVKPKFTRQSITAIVSAALFIAMAAAVSFIPVPFVSWAPGEGVNIYGDYDGKQILNISGVDTYQTSGELLMTTVAVTKVDSYLSLPQAVYSYLNPGRLVLPRAYVYPEDKSNSRISEYQQRQMLISQDSAVIAALDLAKQPVERAVQVVRVSSSGSANGKLQVGDILRTANGTKLESSNDLQSVLSALKPGDPILFELSRDNDPLTVTIVAAAGADNAQAARIGVETDESYSYAAKIDYSLDRSIVGSSAGLIFAIGLYDRMTETDLIAGRTVAGTGVISTNGEVGTVSGVQQKMIAAQKAGAEIFLVPSANCSDIDTSSTSMDVIKVNRLSDAVTSLELLKDPDTSQQVPRC